MRISQPPHVLFLIDHLLAIGGGEGNLLKIVEGMSPAAVRCSIATFAIDADLLRRIPVPVHVFPLRRTYDLGAMRVAWRLCRLIRQENVHIVQTYFETSNLWGGLIAKASGAMLISSRRDMGILRSMKHRIAYRLVNRLCDRVIVVSEEVKRFSLQEHIEPRKIEVVHNGVDLEKIAASGSGEGFRISAELAEASPVISCIANIRRIKGIDLLVRAASMVCREYPDAVFLIAGGFNEPDYVEEVQGMVRSLGLERNIKFLGFLQNPIPLLKASDIFCMLSRSEGFSNALLEAMACGLPSVVTRVGGNPEAITEGQEGYLVAVEDVPAAAARLRFLLGNHAQAKQMGDAARRRVESKFGSQGMIEHLVRIYRGLFQECALFRGSRSA